MCVMVVYALDWQVSREFDASFGDRIRRNVTPGPPNNMKGGLNRLNGELPRLERRPACAGQSLSFARRHNRAVYA